jgi:hypothetical protein
LVKLLLRPDWKPGDLAEWAAGWAAFLASRCLPLPEGICALPPEFVDCTPFNIVRNEQGVLVPFDLEHRSRGPVRLDFVLFRGLWSSISYCRLCSPSRFVGSLRVLDIVQAVLSELDSPCPYAEMEKLIALEAEFQAEITGAPTGITERRLREETLQILGSPGQAVSAIEDGASSYCQLFWRTRETTYSEPVSSIAPYRLNAELQELTLPLPGLNAPLASLRIDLADRPGIVAGLRIRVLDARNQELWSLETAQDGPDVADMALLHTSSAAPSAVLLSRDPALEITLGSENGLRLQEGGRVDCQFKWLSTGEEIHEWLNTMQAPWLAEGARLRADLEAGQEREQAAALELAAAGERERAGALELAAAGERNRQIAAELATALESLERSRQREKDLSDVELGLNAAKACVAKAAGETERLLSIVRANEAAISRHYAEQRETQAELAAARQHAAAVNQRLEAVLNSYTWRLSSITAGNAVKLFLRLRSRFR